MGGEVVQRKGEPWGLFRVRPQRVKWKKEDGWQKSDEKRVWSTLVVEESGPEERVDEEREIYPLWFPVQLD